MHGPSTEWGEDKSSSFKTRVGIWMFLLYAIIYIGFVLINTLNPALMGMNIGSLNLALVYGFGLIIFAILLAFVYNVICTKAEKRFDVTDEPVESETDVDRVTKMEAVAPHATDEPGGIA